MLDKRMFRGGIFAVVLTTLLLAIGLFAIEEQKYCLNVPLIKEEKLSGLTEGAELDLSVLTFNEKKVAADITSGTIYISQAPENLSDNVQMNGTLATTDSRYDLFFLKDAAMEDISAAVRNNTPLTLIATDGSAFQRISVVITTLPVLCLEGEPLYVNEDGRDVLSGNITLWTGFDPIVAHSSTKASAVQWHIRGVTSATADKKSWKLSLKDTDGANNHLDFLGLDADDDWILNAMAMDDTKIREKFFMDLWNANAKTVDYQYKMSSGEYVEVVINNEYLGLFLLQRRVDAKYLELADQDVLLKGTTYQATSAEEAYELVTPNENIEEIYAAMKPVFEMSDCGVYNQDNIIEMNIFLRLASAHDNYGLKNVYHILKKTENGFEHFVLPWDTDMSFGLFFRNGGFCYDYDHSLTAVDTRWETGGVMRANPNYDELAAEQWSAFRESLLVETTLLDRVDVLYEALLQSGALQRDKTLWSERYNGVDTIDNLKRFILERLLFLDEYYGR